MRTGLLTNPESPRKSTACILVKLSDKVESNMVNNPLSGNSGLTRIELIYELSPVIVIDLIFSHWINETSWNQLDSFAPLDCGY